MTEPVKDMPRTEAAMKWGCVASPFVAILLVVLYANDMLTFTKPADPDQQYADRAMASARDSMLDPTAVKFKDLTVSAKARCMYGQILAKNAMGAYTGYRDFVWTNGQTLVSTADQASPFSTAGDIDAVTKYFKAHMDCISAMPTDPGSLPLTIPEA